MVFDDAGRSLFLTIADRLDRYHLSQSSRKPLNFLSPSKMPAYPVPFGFQAYKVFHKNCFWNSGDPVNLATIYFSFSARCWAAYWFDPITQLVIGLLLLSADLRLDRKTGIDRNVRSFATGQNLKPKPRPRFSADYHEILTWHSRILDTTSQQINGLDIGTFFLLLYVVTFTAIPFVLCFL